MKTISFQKNKYSIELLMDLIPAEEAPHYMFEPAIHQTDFFEIIFFEKGKGHLLLDQQKINVNAKTVIFISPYQKRQWYVDKNSISAHFLIFQEDFLNTFFADKFFVYRLQYFFNTKDPLFVKLDEKYRQKANLFFREILREIRNYQSDDSQHIIRSLLYFSLIMLNRFFSATYNLSPETQKNSTAYLFKDILEKHIRSKHQVKDYAQLLGVSRISLNKIVKQQFGITVSAMIKQRLLSEIKNELCYTSKSISEIAFAFNFSEPGNFMRFFKQQTGETPSGFRSSYQNDSFFI